MSQPMADYPTTLINRTLGRIPVLQPLIASYFAPPEGETSFSIFSALPSADSVVEPADLISPLPSAVSALPALSPESSPHLETSLMPVDRHPDLPSSHLAATWTSPEGLPGSAEGMAGSAGDLPGLAGGLPGSAESTARLAEGRTES
ncbi:MAG TPA: hypothetical protein V6C57_11330, partial [Coleofasciculaceae cyanobacterium]